MGSINDAIKRLMGATNMNEMTQGGEDSAYGQIASAIAQANQQSQQDIGFDLVDRSPESMIRQYVELWRQDPKAADEFLEQMERLGVDTAGFKQKRSGVTSGFSAGDQEIMTPYGMRKLPY